MAMPKLNVTVDEQVSEAGRRKRQQTGRSIGDVVARVLRRWIGDPAPKEQPQKGFPEAIANTRPRRLVSAG